jgi:transposase-like protein
MPISLKGLTKASVTILPFRTGFQEFLQKTGIPVSKLTLVWRRRVFFAVRTALELEKRRRLAVARVKEGYSQISVARFLGINYRTVRRWCKRYREHGEAGMTAQPHPGHERTDRPRRRGDRSQQ